MPKPAVSHGASAGPASIPVNPDDFKGSRLVTSQVLVEQVAYSLSDTIFDYSPETFGLDKAVSQWHAAGKSNSYGGVPELVKLETRSGASAAVLGFLTGSATGLSTILGTTASLLHMHPLLRQHLAEVKRHRVAFHIAAVDYAAATGALEVNFEPIVQLARDLNIPLVVSNSSDPVDVHHTAVLASLLGRLGPVIHIYDGIRATLSHKPVSGIADTASVAQLSAPSSIKGAFEAVNGLLGTAFKPFHYEGPSSPSTVLVQAGLPPQLGLNIANTGVVTAKLLVPFEETDFVSALPNNTHEVVVLGQTIGAAEFSGLFRDVATSVNYGGSHRDATVSQVTVNSLDRFSPHELASQLRQNVQVINRISDPVDVLILDLDKSSTVAAAAPLVRALNNANVPVDLYTIYDNTIRGGIVESQIHIGHLTPFTIQQAQAVLVNDAVLLKSVPVVERTANKGTLCVIAASAEDVEKALTDEAKKEAAQKQLQVFTLDLSELDSSNTQGRTGSMAVQAAFYYLTDKSLNADQITSRIVHSNSTDTELIAATVHKIVDHVKEKALRLVDTKEWSSIKIEEQQDKDKAPKNTTTTVRPTNFVPAPSVAIADEFPVESYSEKDIAHRIVFPEAYGQSSQLRPDLPTQNFISKVKVNQRVTPSDYDRHIFHLELDITGTGLKYSIGEALGIHAPNNSEAVLQFLEWYGVNPEEVIGVPNRDDVNIMEHKTVYHALRDNLDIFGKVPKRFYETLAEYATNDKQKVHLEKLCSSEGAAELKRRADEDFDNYVDILKEFNSAHPPISVLAENVGPLKRREYSIASSQKVHPNAVHLLIVVVDWVNKEGQKRFGQCSKYLSSLKEGAEVTVSVKPSVMKLPKDPKTPIIMAGLGTGLAPFKAFLEEKQWQKEHGEEIGDIYLFLGSRHQRQEYLYGELFEAYKNAGILTHIGAAFSRDQAHKIYIQHRINEAKESLTDAFVNKQGNFYLCGPTWPVPDVSEALADIVCSEAAARGEKVDGERVVEDLKDKERYILEVY